MNVTVALEMRYTVAPDGSVWSPDGMARPFWERYLEVFDTVRVVARGARAERIPDDWRPATGPNITFHALPDFNGPLEYLQRYGAVSAAVRSAASQPGAYILRVGSQIGNMMESRLRRRKHPYALEVVGDPYDVFAPGVVEHPLRPFFRWYFSHKLRRQCANALGVAYVTREFLQKRYPTRVLSADISDVDLTPEAVLRSPGFSTYYSSVELHCGKIEQRLYARKAESCRIVTVGSLEQLYKGTDVLIEAVARCVREGMDLDLVIVGDGRFRTELMAQTERAGISSRVLFTGRIGAGEPVRKILDTADLFVLPSRTEGLPRAIIEAMARGLPCIGSAVGGIPELIGPDELVPPDNAAALAAKMKEVLTDPLRMSALSQTNLERAREFSADVLTERRRKFYRHVRDFTAHREGRTE